MLLMTFLTFGHIWSQGFPCDGTGYLISYTRSVGETTLYEISDKLQYRGIKLSERRRLTGLAYNVTDTYLYAVDVDSYELIRIERSGQLNNHGKLSNVTEGDEFHSGVISADGGTYYLIGHNPRIGSDERFYSVNLRRNSLHAGHQGITGDRRYKISDLAIDPLSGTFVGYDQIEGRVANVAIGGNISSPGTPSSGQFNIAAMFFMRSGVLVGFAPSGGFYRLNRAGSHDFLAAGPAGTHADGCSCPYTYSFTKDITPREILPCEEFKVIYRFNNQMGIGQTWITLQDTFPEGYEIVNIKSKIVTSENIVPSPSNILLLQNLIYVMRDNEIELTVKAPANATRTFESRAYHHPFPIAFPEIDFSDDPMTEAYRDPTEASIIHPSELDLIDYVSYSCDGTEAIIRSPVLSDAYVWSTGAMERTATTNELGWVSLEAQGECFYFHDSVYIEKFPEPKALLITGEDKIVSGTSMILSAQQNRGTMVKYSWSTDKGEVVCLDCHTISVNPVGDYLFKLRAEDVEGCITEASHFVEVILEKHLYTPNIFSPNSDGVNDFFNISSNAEGELLSLKVYDRWGNEIFDISRIPLGVMSQGWDGRYKGKVMSSDVYIWAAEILFADGERLNRSGTVTLINY